MGDRNHLIDSLFILIHIKRVTAVGGLLVYEICLSLFAVKKVYFTIKHCIVSWFLSVVSFEHFHLL